MSLNIEAIEARIVGETYELRPDGRTTLCELTLDNDWNVRGESTCLHMGDFDVEEGKRLARVEAFNELAREFAFMAREDAHRAAAREVANKPKVLAAWLGENGAALTVLLKMVDMGPLEADRIPSKVGRNALLEKGLASESLDIHGEYRYGATGKGVEALCALYGVSTLREVQTTRYARRMAADRARASEAKPDPQTSAAAPTEPALPRVQAFAFVRGCSCQHRTCEHF